MRILKLMSTENKFHLWKGSTSSDFIFSSEFCVISPIKIAAITVINIEMIMNLLAGILRTSVIC